MKSLTKKATLKVIEGTLTSRQSQQILYTETTAIYLTIIVASANIPAHTITGAQWSIINNHVKKQEKFKIYERRSENYIRQRYASQEVR